jgi:hypothetical protein
MEPLIAIGALGLGALWLGGKAVRRLRRQNAAAKAARARADRERQVRLCLANRQARDLQLALLRLAQAPDFRRAASFARAATAVPLPFKHRQFRRFRGRILAHFTARLAAGGDVDALTSSLTAFLKGLGIPSYEADYIRTEAERTVAGVRRRPAPSFSQRLDALQREHQERMQAIRGQSTLDEETREQLLEAETTRHREALERAGTRDDPTQPPTP